ncbi:putative stomatin/prohibitin-family membrane protease subunit YbbK [Thermosynechococcus sp. NK55a]|uniref:SPFH domain-containing protein n=1 Tax=Thermosynechococcus sp. NK55a TaxID=1394889 RepID=UPI0003D7FF73|nr:SPFH domain-containing protein [Thermosynechococcus sp. NK55a]AHB88802.1 putative stomatin/prohibitin-family membrane protease subunit YbbK [Thermosynechococcus sp. NK55a]
MNELFALLFIFGLGTWGIPSSVRIIKQGNMALVERLGSYHRRLEPGLNLIVPLLERVAFEETIREKVLDIPPQQCITRDNVTITVDAVVYWRIINMERAYYRVENLKMAMVNLVQTQIRAEMGRLELDETFTARTQVNENLLRDLDIATDPWGVKVTRVELRDIAPSKAVQDSMELQMSAERKKRAAILTSEGEREAAINSARGKAEAQVLAAEAEQKAAILAAEAEQKVVVLRAQAERQDQILRAQGTAEAMKIIAAALHEDPKTKEALQFLLAQSYLDMGRTIGHSDSSKVLFIDPSSIPATIEGVKSLIEQSPREV